MTDPYSDDAERAHRISRRFGRVMDRWRAVIRRRPWLNTLYKVIVTILGVGIVIGGLILVPLPGPGWLIVFIGLTILGTEYHWARRLLQWLRKILARFWERWNKWRAERRERKARQRSESQRRQERRIDARRNQMPRGHSRRGETRHGEA